MKKLSEIFEKHCYKISIAILFIMYIIMIIDVIIRYDNVLEILKEIGGK